VIATRSTSKETSGKYLICRLGFEFGEIDGIHRDFHDLIDSHSSMFYPESRTLTLA
jgi:hypothetical protein